MFAYMASSSGRPQRSKVGNRMGDIIHSLTVTEKEEEIEQFHYSMDHNSDTENNMASDRPSQVDNVNVDDTEELEQRLQDLRTERRKAELR